MHKSGLLVLLILVGLGLLAGAVGTPVGGGVGGSTGATDNAILRADGTGGATLQANSGWKINDSGVLIAAAGNTYDIGTSTDAEKPRDVQVSRTLTVGSSGALFGFANVANSGTVNTGLIGDSTSAYMALKTGGTERLRANASGLFARRPVANDIDGGTLAADDVRGQLYTNTGDTDGQTFNLPAAAAGMYVTFLLSASEDITVNPDDADVITHAGVTFSAGDAISSDETVGSRITLIAIDSVNWMSLDFSGTWTDVN